MRSAIGNITGILVVRLQRGENVIESITTACEKNRIKNAVIISMIGSFDGAAYYDPIINPKERCGISYGDPLIHVGPSQLLTAQGEVCQNEKGEVNVHLHATFADSKGNAFGGHISGLVNRVLNTVNVFIGVIDGVDMSYEYDELLDGMVFCPKQIETANNIKE